MLWWALLMVAVVAEVVATVMLRASEGLTRPGPTAVVVVGYGLAFWLLSRIVGHLPTSVTYAVWAAAGIALVTLVSTLVLDEPMTLAKGVCLALIVVGVVGLNLVGGSHAVHEDASSRRAAAVGERDLR